MSKRLDDDWRREVIRIELSEAEFERRLGAMIRALLEIDEILGKREIAASSEREAA